MEGEYVNPFRKRSGNPLPQLVVLALGVAALSLNLSAQVMLVDRGLASGQGEPATRHWAGLHAAWVNDRDSFVGDDFSVGGAGEVWVIDTVRVWSLADKAPGPLFEKMTLYGGVAGEPVPKEQAECGCHGLTALKTAGASGSSDVSVSPVGELEYVEEGITFRVWQLEFRNLRWSVPGGAPIQFAVRTEGARDWFNYASPVKVAHHLRVFDRAGQLRSFLGGDANGINLQVWGHLSAKVEIRRAGSFINATLSGSPAFDIARVDLASLRLGRGGSGPVSSQVRDTDRHGNVDLVLAFREMDATLPPGAISICLTGKRLDGVPFEGCDLLARGKP